MRVVRRWRFLLCQRWEWDIVSSRGQCGGILEDWNTGMREYISRIVINRSE